MKDLIGRTVVLDGLARADRAKLLDFGGVDRFDKIPVIVRVYEPPKADHRVIEQVLVPEVFDAVERHAARGRSDDLEFNVAGEDAFCPDRGNKIRLPFGGLERVKECEVSLIDIE